jgi:hypothetical protein
MAERFESAAAFRQSLEARLATVAEQRGVDLNRLRLQLVIERLLARLFAEADSPWLVKGGFAMDLRLRPSARATRDLDLSCRPPAGDVRDRLAAAAERDLGDHLVFRVGTATRPIEAAPEGGARFSVEARLAGREYARFHVDVGIGTPLGGRPERLVGDDLLNFAGIAAAVVLVVPRELQFAEKLHAYTRPWGDRVNTRTKDLVDLVSLIEAGRLDRGLLVSAIDAVFRGPPPRPIPDELPAPPSGWREAFEAMADEVGLQARELEAAFAVLVRFWDQRRR